MLKKIIKSIFLIALVVQNAFCMKRTIGESLSYRDSSSFAIVSEANKALFKNERHTDLFRKLTDEILRWQYIDFSNVAFECLKDVIVFNVKRTLAPKLRTWLNADDYSVALAGEILGYDQKKNPREDFDWAQPNIVLGACYDVIQKALPLINQHISFARLIAIDDNEGELSYRINYIPFLFLSGTFEANSSILDDNPLKTMVRFIDSYGFYSTSDQAYSHSERALCLAISNDFGDRKLLDFVSDNTIDLCIQVRNLSRMCINCEHFIFGRDIYFTKVGGRGCFVKYDYKVDYEKCDSTLKKRSFIKKYNKELRLMLSDETIDCTDDNEIVAIFEQIMPKSILELIPYSGTLILETMNSERLAEVVKIYLP